MLLGARHLSDEHSSGRRRGNHVQRWLGLNFDTSYNGMDLLHTVLRSAQVADSAFCHGDLNELEMVFQQNCGYIADCGNMVAIDEIFDPLTIGSP